MIDGVYRKWNNNFGVVEQNMEPEDYSNTVASNAYIDFESIAFLLGKKNIKSSLRGSLPIAKEKSRSSPVVDCNQYHALGAILEEEEEEEEGHSELFDVESSEESSTTDASVGSMVETSESSCFEFDSLLAATAELAPPERSFASIPPEDFAQAFSHFSYVRSGGNLMVVDLQGALHIDESEGSAEFVFTDPAIHKRHGAYNFRLNFGRTNRGTKGIYAIFNSHVCNDACRLLGLRPKPRKNDFNETQQETSKSDESPK